MDNTKNNEFSTDIDQIDQLDELIRKNDIFPYRILKTSLDAAIHRDIELSKILLNYARTLIDSYFNANFEKVNFIAMILVVELVEKIVLYNYSEKQYVAEIDQFKSIYKDSVI